MQQVKRSPISFSRVGKGPPTVLALCLSPSASTCCASATCPSDGFVKQSPLRRIWLESRELAGSLGAVGWLTWGGRLIEATTPHRGTAAPTAKIPCRTYQYCICCTRSSCFGQRKRLEPIHGTVIPVMTWALLQHTIHTPWAPCQLPWNLDSPALTILGTSRPSSRRRVRRRRTPIIPMDLRS